MPNEYTEKLAKIFLEARQELGLTQLEVAEKASLTANAYARIERGERQPSSDSLRKLVKALGIDPSKVL
jgi:transcriptional regulator with XRE-family HTH domain